MISNRNRVNNHRYKRDNLNLIQLISKVKIESSKVHKENNRVKI